MSGIEVWKMWYGHYRYRDYKFKSEKGNVISYDGEHIKLDDGTFISAHGFLKGDWTLVEEWEEVGIMEALKELVVNRGEIKKEFKDGSGGVYSLEKDNYFILHDNLEDGKWFIRRK